VEVILSLLAWKVLYPDSMHLSRGNHESHSMNKIYGFDGEVSCCRTSAFSCRCLMPSAASGVWARAAHAHHCCWANLS
jgi:hypothetical protein